jgi:peptidyl-prolyl cis-trans isomerase A (cyclophilin A)
MILLFAMPVLNRMNRALGLGLGLLLPLAGVTQDGIFADFSTSQGSFRCQLHYEQSPRAVANFIALVTGTRPWMEQANGQVRTDRFYEGLSFHRVIPGFMIQAGSPNGQGNDGPGYVFPDQFHAQLRHDGSGKLSMANTGPNSNGSQFFITVAATPWLDDVHTIFGQVTQGADVVHRISQVETDEQDRPREPVHLHNVSIERIGAAAEAFDIHAQGLPEVMGDSLAARRHNEGVQLAFARPAHADLRLRESTDLEAWTSHGMGIELHPTEDQEIQRGFLGDTRFFALTRVQYPSSTLAPRKLADRAVRVTFTGDPSVLVLELDGDKSGVYTFGTEHSGTITSWTWVQEVYRGRLTVTTSGLVPMMLRMDFTGELGGNLVGTFYANAPFTLSGTFTLSPTQDP